jgi:hypothetical protein
VDYKINLRFRRPSCGTGQITRLSAYYIARDPTMLRAAQPTREPTILLKMASTHEPATISPCTITMDHDAIISSMIDRLARGPDHDVHVPSVGGTKVPFSWCRCHILVIDYRWGSMGSNETAITIPGGPRVIDVFYGNGAPSGPNCLLFSDADRLSDSLWDRSGVR